MVKRTNLSIIIEEIEKTRAALTVLYEKTLEENKDLAKQITKIDQRCKALEFRLKRVENTLQGDIEHPGIVTQLWHIKNNLDKGIEELPSSDILYSIPPNKPSNTINVHPVWIRLIIPILVSAVLILTTILTIILLG